MTSPAAVTTAAVADAYAAQQQATRAQVLRYLTASWAALTSWRAADADRFAAQAAVVVTGGQQRVAALTGVYLAQAIRAAGGTPGPPPRFAVSDRDIRGVDARQVYRRPFNQIWTDLSRGVPLDRAVTKAEQRLRTTALTDLQLAKTHASRTVYEAAGDVTGYRRVLNGPTSCALCVIASTQRYAKANLLPIHPGCDCSTAPILGRHSHELVIDAQLLAKAHSAVRGLLGISDAGGRAPDYRQVMIKMTHDHGEMGPLLARPRDKFTTIEDTSPTASPHKPRLRSVEETSDTRPVTPLLNSAAPSPRTDLAVWGTTEVDRIAAIDRGHDRDDRLAAIWRAQGFDGAPRVVSPEEFDQLAGDHTVLYRGIGGGEAARWAEEFRTGDAFPGVGAYGNGTYTATELAEARGYATIPGWRGSDADGVVLRMGLPKDARVITQQQLRIQMAEDPAFPRDGSSSPHDAAFGDPGRYAAAHGYDAIEIAPDPGSIERNFVVLNRSKLVVDSRDLAVKAGEGGP